jgi:hypothetical protein
MVGECHIAASVSVIIFDRAWEKCFDHFGVLNNTIKHFLSKGFSGE